MKLCKRCEKFEVGDYKVSNNLLCKFCRLDYSRAMRIWKSEFALTKGSKRVWVGKGICPIDLNLIA